MAPSAQDEKRPAVTARPPTIGLLVDCLEDSYQWSVLRGAMDAASDHGARLLCFAGGVLEAPQGEGGERNGVFDLAGPKIVDALIVLSGVIGNRIGPERLRVFCERYRPLPMCSIAVELGEMSSVCIDNESGMRAAIEHLIRAHDRKAIAFVRGPTANAEAERRFEIYKEVLGSAGLPLLPERVVVGDFERAGGRAAVRTLLGERKLSLQDVDAIVAANDATALGALDELESLGIQVPDQIAVIGFDDIEESRLTVPSLTTVRQPLYEQGRDAVRIVLEQLRAGAPPERIVRHTELVTRRSCGCLAAPATTPRESVAPPDTLGFEAALVEAWRRMRAEKRARALGRAAAAIASSHDLDELSRAVEEHLAPLGITRCFVATFNGTSGEQRRARLALMHTPRARHFEAPSWQLQPIEDILRDHVLPNAGEHALAVLPTVYKGEELGVLVLELEALDGYLYETLRDVFTAALAGARPLP
jgi:DNA-binding LacI/PurR family transcriptional regulator